MEDYDCLDCSLSDSKQYLKSMSDPDAPPLSNNLSENEITDLISSMNRFGTTLHSSEMEITLRIYAKTMSTLMNSNSHEVILQASRLALIVMNLKAASAIGCHTYVAFSVLHTQLNKLLDSYLKQDMSNKRRGGRIAQSQQSSHDEDDEDNESVQFDIASVDFSQQSATNRRVDSRSQNSSISKSCLKSFLETLKESVSMTRFIKDEDQLLAYAQLLWRFLYFLVIYDEYKSIVNLMKDIVMNFSTLSKKTFFATHRTITPIMTFYQGRNTLVFENQKVKKTCFVATCQVYAELLKSAFVRKDFQYDEKSSENHDESKEDLDIDDEDDESGKRGRRSSRKIGTPTENMDDSYAAEAPSSEMTQKTTSTIATRQNDRSMNESMTTTMKAKFSIGYIYVFGLLQRMILGSPDRANIRNLIAEAVVDIFTTIGTLHEEYEMLTSVESFQPISRSRLQYMTKEAIYYFIHFLHRLSKSNKIQYRAFSLEIVCQLSVKDWLWKASSFMNSSTNAILSTPMSSSRSHIETPGSSGSTVTDLCGIGEMLLSILLRRCEDTSSSVRFRAIAAFADLLDTITYESSASLMNALYDIMMGMNTSLPVTNSTTSKRTAIASSKKKGKASIIVTNSLFDILRMLFQDEKPLVRAKTIQVYGYLFSKTWWKVPNNVEFTNIESGENDEDEQDKYFREEVNIHLSEEDIFILCKACQDESIAVRKQAIQSFSSILMANASSVTHHGNEIIPSISKSLIINWIQSCFTLANDRESTVVMKLANQCQEMILKVLYQWYQTVHKTSQSTSTIVVMATSSNAMLAWELLLSIESLGLLSTLKSLFGFMLKQNLLTLSNSVYHDTILGVVSICKTACMLVMDSQLSNSNNPHYQLFQRISKAAWILLEVLMTQSYLRVHDPIFNQMILLEDYYQTLQLTSFVIKYYQSKHISTSQKVVASLYNDEDIRVLKVFNKITTTLTKQEIDYMRNELDQRLFTITLSVDQIHEIVSTRYQLSKALSMETTTVPSGNSKKKMVTSTSSNANVFIDDVVTWSSKLTIQLYAILQIYLFQKLPDGISSHDLSVSLSLSTIVTVSSHGMITIKNEEKLLELVNISLFLLGELMMLGFKIDETESKNVNHQQKLTNYTMSSQFQFHYLYNNSSSPILTDTANSAAGGTIAATTTVGSEQFRLLFPLQIVDFVKMFMGLTLPAIDTDNNSGDNRQCPARLRAVAFVTMGKLCLRNHKLARDSINIFLREITRPNSEEERGSTSALMNQSIFDTTVTTATTSESLNSPEDPYASVRINALLVLSDLCIRHTHLVDHHIDTIATCLQDANASVRKTTLLIITQLLVQDFLKWKHLLLYRMLLLLIDPDQEIVMLVREVFDTTLSLKYPGLLQQHFSEAFVIFNQCYEHPIYATMLWTKDTQPLIPKDLDSVMNSQENSNTNSRIDLDEIQPMMKLFANDFTTLSRAQKFEIYQFMAKGLSDELKIQITAKLVNDILGSAVDFAKKLLPDRNQMTSLSSWKQNSGTNSSRKNSAKTSSNDNQKQLSPFETAIEDVFVFLRSPLLKIGNKKALSDDADFDDSNTINGDNSTTGATMTTSQANQALAAAKSKILKSLSSQHLVSHLLPVVMSLKHCLEQFKSPLQGALMEYLIYLVKINKTEVDQVLQSDPTLKAEVEYDIRLYERQKKQEKSNIVTANQLHSTQKVPKISPYIDAKTLQAGSLIKPKLLQSASSSIIRSGATATRRSTALVVEIGANNQFTDDEDDEEDPFARLAVNPLPEGATDFDEINNGEALMAPPSKDMTQKQLKRRSWGVVVGDLLSDNTNNEPKSKSKVSRESLLLDDLDHDEDRPSSKKAKRSNSTRISHSKSLSSSFAAIAADVSSIVNMSEIGNESIVSSSKKAASRLSSRPSNEKLFADSPIVASSNSSSKASLAKDSKQQESSVSKNLNMSSFTTAVADEVMQPPPPVDGQIVKRRSKHQFTSDSLFSLG